MNPENSNIANSNNPELSSVPPPPPPFNNVTPPPSPFNSASPPLPPQSSAMQPHQGNGLEPLLELLFPSHLRTAYQGATPEQLLRLYGWRIAVAVLLLFLIVKFAYALFSLLLVIAFICLLVGLFNPESFQPLFGEKTSKATVGWTFGAAVCFCAHGASITEPKREVVTPTTTTVLSHRRPRQHHNRLKGRATMPRHSR